jgi:UDP-N-acetylmuramyl pentapeptide phosphotransferase/UDP-N-acetylglucosamine-1-phosphate transferase
MRRGIARSTRLAAGVGLGAVAARAAYTALTRRPPGLNGLPGEQVWGRTNHRGEPVTLLEGPAFVAGAAAAGLLAPGATGRIRAAALLAGAGSGALGGYDDLAGSASSRGFKGHLTALARGEVTSGAVKILGIGATGLAAAAVAGSPAPTRTGRAFDTLVNGAVVAGSANLMNLFDLRPGRAVKVGLIAGTPLALTRSGAAVVAAPLGAAAALLPEDLGERAMLGDTGANALGALLGLAATRLGRGPRLAVLAGVTGLNAASEFVSFTKVIAGNPVLNRVDMLGRRPVAVPAPAAAEAARQETGEREAGERETGKPDTEDAYRPAVPPQADRAGDGVGDPA